VSINQELLRTFVDVGTAKTFSEAAVRRHITPSAISQQIRTLETQLGVQLFERFGRRARLTDSGRALLTSLQKHFAGIDLAVSEVREKLGVVRGTVRIGAPGPFSRVWLRPRIIHLMQRHPDLIIEAQFNVTSHLVRGLLDGAYDFCVLASEPEPPAIEVAPIFVEHFVAVASAEYLAAHGRPQTAAEFRQHRYVVFDADLAMQAPWWRAYFGQREAMPTRVAARVGSLDEMLALATSGLGIAVLPNYFVSTSIAAGQVAPIEVVLRGGRRGPRNQIYLGWRRGTPASARFVTVKDVLLSPRPNDAVQG
jgi:DNA-binding transcriptional LysR family regulator